MIIFLLRHADRAADMSDALSPKGIARAKRLALMLAESGVSQAYSSDTKRTHATLSPLKEKLGDALIITEASTAAPGGPTAHVQEIVAAISALPAAAVAIVVSHSNTVGPIIAGLGGGAIASIAESEFDKLFILSGSPSGEKALVLIRY